MANIEKVAGLEVVDAEHVVGLIRPLQDETHRFKGASSFVRAIAVDTPHQVVAMTEGELDILLWHGGEQLELVASALGATVMPYEWKLAEKPQSLGTQIGGTGKKGKANYLNRYGLDGYALCAEVPVVDRQVLADHNSPGNNEELTRIGLATVDECIVEYGWGMPDAADPEQYTFSPRILFDIDMYCRLRSSD